MTELWPRVAMGLAVAEYRGLPSDIRELAANARNSHPPGHVRGDRRRACNRGPGYRSGRGGTCRRRRVWVPRGCRSRRPCPIRPSCGRGSPLGDVDQSCRGRNPWRLELSESDRNARRHPVAFSGRQHRAMGRDGPYPPYVCPTVVAGKNIRSGHPPAGATDYSLLRGMSESDLNQIMERRSIAGGRTAGAVDRSSPRPGSAGRKPTEDASRCDSPPTTAADVVHRLLRTGRHSTRRPRAGSTSRDTTGRVSRAQLTQFKRLSGELSVPSTRCPPPEPP